MTALAIVLLVAGAALACWIGASRASHGTERRLLRLCRGDAALAERLIDYEMRRAPGSTRKQAATQAIHSFRRDNA